MPSNQNSSVAALHKIIAEAQSALAALGVEGVDIKTTKNKAEKANKTEKVKKVGQVNAWTAFGKSVYAEHPAEVAAWKAEQEAAGLPKSKQTMPCFASYWKESHKDEYDAFAAEWKESHPKSSGSSVADDASVTDDASVVSEASIAKPKKAGRKKIADMTPEEKAADEAKKAAKKASKAAVAKAEEVEASKEVSAPVAAPVVTIITPVAPIASAAESEVEEDDEPEMMPFKLDGTKYFRLGTNNGTGKIAWVSGDLWSWTKAGQGSYYGLLKDDGSIDTDAQEPDLC